MPSDAEPRQEKSNARKGHSLQWKEVIYKTKVPKIKVMPSYAKPRQEKTKCKPIEMHNHVMCLQTIENKAMLMHSNHRPNQCFQAIQGQHARAQQRNQHVENQWLQQNSKQVRAHKAQDQTIK
jgi:hypothetical protein